jgi:hypothetical protein
MTLPSPFELKEIRYVDNGATFPTAFTAANDASWAAGTATKLRVHDLDVTGLTYESVKDMTAQTRHRGRPYNLPTIKGGSFTFKMWAEGGSSTTSPGTLATLLGKIFGGIKSPTAITDTAETGSTATQIKASTHGQVRGQACLFGTRGDGKGGGKVGIISEVNGTDHYTLQMSLPAAPINGDAIKNGHTIYLDPDDENYLSFLIIGHYPGSGAADDGDQINAIGCWCEVAVGGLAVGEHPFFEFTVHVGDWRNEPYATKASLAHTTEPSGNDPAGSQYIGSLCIGDAGTYTRTTVQGGDYEISPNLSWEEIRDLNGVNGRGGAVKMPHEDGPTIAVTRYWGDMPGLFTDFSTAHTKIQTHIQLGHETQNCIAFDMPEAYLDNIPERIEFERAQALKLTMHGDSKRETDLSTDDYKLQDSPFKIHFL